MDGEKVDNGGPWVLAEIRILAPVNISGCVHGMCVKDCLDMYATLVQQKIQSFAEAMAVNIRDEKVQYVPWEVQSVTQVKFLTPEDETKLHEPPNYVHKYGPKSKWDEIVTEEKIRLGIQ